MTHGNVPFSESIPLRKIAEYDRPVVFTTGGGSRIYHLPRVENESAYPVCDLVSEGLRITSLRLFTRRRNTRMCQNCKKRVDGDTEYPADAAYGPDDYGDTQ